MIKKKKVHGVQIYCIKPIVHGSEAVEKKDGSFRIRKPMVETFYIYGGSYKYTTLMECIDSIEDLFSKASLTDEYTAKDWAITMNEDLDTDWDELADWNYDEAYSTWNGSREIKQEKHPVWGI